MREPGRVHVLPDVLEIAKDPKGHIGVSIGGGAPYCPSLYVVQVFDGGVVAKDGRLHAGDEIVAVNGASVRGMEKGKVAKMIKEMEGPLKLSVNRLQFDDEAGQTLDITIKRIKHWWVEKMDAKTADAFGFSRAILCNDVLAQLMKKLDANQALYTELTRHADNMTRCHRKLADAQNLIASQYNEIASREAYSDINKYFSEVAQCQRNFTKEANPLVAKVGSIAETFRTYTEKAIPDTKDTIKKYLDKKFEYLSFCLKIKEMDDEEAQMIDYGDYLPRIDSGNLEYRIMLRSREKSRDGFIEMRRQVMIKIEMLDEKHVRELGLHLRTLMEALHSYHRACAQILSGFKENTKDLSIASTTAKQKSNHNNFINNDNHDDDQAPLICTD